VLRADNATKLEGGLTCWLCRTPEQVVEWLYRGIGRPPAHEEGPKNGGDKGRDGFRQRERSEEEGRRPHKRPRSPSAEKDADRRPSSSRNEDQRKPPVELTNTLAARRVGGAVSQSRCEDDAPPRENAALTPGPTRAALEELATLIDHLCDHGDSCPSLRDEGLSPCESLHSAGLAALGELPPWLRETALTLVRAHPLADPTSAAKAREGLARDGQPAWGVNKKWKNGLTRIVRRWLNHPEVRAEEAPPVPAPHPDAAPSGAPRGVKRSDLEDLKALVGRLCIRVLNCRFFRVGSCHAVHPGHLRTAQVSPWVHDELERLLRTHPYRHLNFEAYQKGRCEATERAWKAALIRQVDKWIEWHEADEL
jgi:hypothetical protein